MGRFITWMKKEKLVVFLVIVIGVLLWGRVSVLPPVPMMSGVTQTNFQRTLEMPMAKVAGMMPDYQRTFAPSDSANRMVVTTTSLSMQVADVEVAIGKIQGSAEVMGGFLVNSSLSKPEGAASGSITVRVPSVKLRQALDAFRGMGVKVVSENVYGTDVTDQYEDLEARLSVLTKTKAKFESIMENAVGVNDLLSVQRELVNIQSQIDSVKGQEKYIEQTAKLSLVAVYLSTDDLALPYTPDVSWRPAVVFKEAVRSLILNLRNIGSGAIWLVVYSPVWVGLLAVGLIFRGRLKK